MSVLDSLPDRWSGMRREWEMIAEMIGTIVIPDPPVITHGLEYIGEHQLAAPANVIALSDLSCGLASAGAKYRCLKFYIFIKAQSVSVAATRMHANDDAVETNYYNHAGVNNSNILTAALTAAAPHKVYRGEIFRTGCPFGSGINEYLAMMQMSNWTPGVGPIASDFHYFWKWRNLANDTILNKLEILASTENFDTGSLIRLWGMRPGI